MPFPKVPSWAISLIWLIAVSIGGCGSDRSKPVADSTMIDVLIEMHVLNARIHVTDRPMEGARDSIFHRYGIDSSAFVRAMDYYARHPDQYAEVYGRVVDELAAERAPINGPDSLLERPGLTPPSP